MPRWPIRVKLIAGLSLVVGMMLTLMGGSIFGLHAFHASNRTLTDQLPELGASKDLLEAVLRIDAATHDTPEAREALARKVETARIALDSYFKFLKRNALSGNRADDGRDEFGLAFEIDHELSTILAILKPEEKIDHALPGTPIYLKSHPEAIGTLARDNRVRIPQHIERLNTRAMELPNKLHNDLFAVLETSKGHYRSSRVIVWTSALAVLAMLCGLARLFHRWVLYPVRLLHRGVRRVARGSFDYRIELQTGDEMQALAEAFNDMTERLGGIYADLEQQVAERSRQLVRSERLAGVGFLAAGVAHEINNPLASIAFCSEALEHRLAPLLDSNATSDADVLRNYLRMIQEEAFRCKRITERLLDFSRCGEIRRERTDLTELIQGVVEMVCHMGKYRSKLITFQPREAVLAYADAQEIKQIVLNLVVNALDSMEEGGNLRIDLKYSGGMAEMTFRDDGCGMPPDVLENIFEPFFTRRQVGKGTGLGLSICHRIVSQHQGEITANSPGIGLGSTFTVRLPSQPAQNQNRDGESVSEARHRICTPHSRRNSNEVPNVTTLSGADTRCEPSSD